MEDFEIYNRKDRMQQMEQQGRVYDVTFMVCGTISLLVGGLIGIFAGIGFGRAMAVLTQQAMSVTPSMMLTGFSCAVVVGIFFGFYPAVRAARLSLVEALRYE